MEAKCKNVGNSAIKKLSQSCPNLFVAFLNGMKQVTDEGVIELVSRCPIETLFLSATKVTGKNLFARSFLTFFVLKL